jgi:HlyD family secretion protein
MNARVDLRELAVDRPPRTADGRLVRRPRAVFSRYVVPATILSGFVAVLGWSLRDTLWPATAVTVVPVVASRAEFVAADTPLFQAAGWIEPRPQPVVVTALAEGIVEQMLVVEGQRVEAGQVVARLIRRDAEIEVARAEADVRLRQAELAAALAGQTAARSLFEEPIPRQAELAAAEAELTKTETELARLPALVRGAEARRSFAEQEVESKTKSRDTVPAIMVQRAKSDLETVLASLDEYRQQALSLDRQKVALVKRRDILQRQLDLKVEETRQLADSQAKVAAAEAQLQQARAALDAAQLKLERMEVRAAVSGRVLALSAKPGMRLMGIDRAALTDASTVITMYDPASLQVRADVRLEDVPGVSVGQQVRIETPAHPQPLQGQVLVATALTDIQKNTLQIKLAIDEPPAVLKPDMLVQVTFLAPPRPSGGTGLSASLRVLAPRQVIEGTGSEATVWVADQAQATARRRRITVGATTSDDLVEITTGLNVGDRVIVSGRESLTDGARIRIVRDDPDVGHAGAAATPTPATPVKSSQIQRYGGKEGRN